MICGIGRAAEPIIVAGGYDVFAEFAARESARQRMIEG